MKSNKGLLVPPRMIMHELFGYALALLVGVSLGMIGSGGSILTVPILVYVMGISPTLATAYSLFIVGTTALAGVIMHGIQKLIHVRAALVFLLPSFITVYSVRRFGMPAIPEVIAEFGSYIISKNIAIMLVFSALMLAASISMIRSARSTRNHSNCNNASDEDMSGINFHLTPSTYPIILAEGTVIGAITGAVGAGGGFLIIPALVLLTKLPMRLAVGTSLLVIAANSLIGFLGDVQVTHSMNWQLLLTFTGTALLGMLGGLALSRRVAALQLRILFGWFLVFMSLYILIKELLLPSIL
ncbi:MAG: sulfite exporter TauE/SafE family protein [Bacteroidota bacterium]|nr:sulfite exporter TauE/SafE family protein [Candidatus Kapabacteria bacterium]MDW8219684.1 sulfite exporter TauE/SafE family protein [Bacteroidota bacterium]